MNDERRPQNDRADGTQEGGDHHFRDGGKERADDLFEEEVAAQQRRLIRFRTHGDRSLWHGLGMIGLVGWTIVLPVLIGTAAGTWLDRRLGGGIRFTLGMIALGVIVGGVNVWNWLERERKS